MGVNRSRWSKSDWQRHHQNHVCPSVTPDSTIERRLRPRLEKEITARLRRELTPDPTDWTMVCPPLVINGLVALRLNFPNCNTYGGDKIAVYRVPGDAEQVELWRSVDPHFREGSEWSPMTLTEIGRAMKANAGAIEAPAPIARFPGSDEGWRMAEAFMRAWSSMKGA